MHRLWSALRGRVPGLPQVLSGSDLQQAARLEVSIENATATVREVTRPDDESGDGGEHVNVVAETSYRLLVSAVRDYAIFMLDPIGRVVSWNTGAAALKGYTEAEVLGRHFSLFYPQERLDQGWPDHALQVAAAEGRIEDEGWRVRKDGTRFWANVVITALRDEAGLLVGFGKVTRDLTERRAQAEALRQSEERFRTMVDAVSDYAIFMLDPHGIVTTWNVGAQRLKGYAASEIVGTHFSAFYPVAAIKRGWPAHELRVATLEGRFEDEGWRIRKDGTRFWAHVTISSVRDETGILRGFTKITRDLTERRNKDEELRRSEARFRSLVEGVQEYAIVMLDADGNVSSWNRGAVRIQGYEADEIVHKHISRFYTSEDVASHKPWNDLARARVTGKLTDEGYRVRKDGSLYWARTALTSLLNTDGVLYGFAHVTQDLTERRNAEKLAETTERMHEFIAMLAHELRNPLAPIRNAVALMAIKGLQDPALESMRETIDRQSNQLARLVDDLLDVNRIARGEFSIAKENVDVAQLLRRSVEASRPFIEAHGHRLHEDYPARGVAVHGDPVRLIQALVNLLNNAANYTPDGGDIWLSVKAADSDVEICVRDSGRGMERAHLDTVFDLFVQVDAEHGDARGGLGVGLALVRRVVELHAGSIRARSPGLGRGSEFLMRLPVARDGIEAVGRGEPALPPATHPADPHELRVLVVDDNQDAADSLQLVLQAMSQDVTVAYDGPTALKLARTFRPDVVMLDIGMPQMSGYEVAARLRDAEETRNALLVAVTGWAQPADRVSSRQAGFDYHFSKPVDPQTLRDILLRAGSRKRRG